MSFLITVAVPKRQNFNLNIDEMKSAGMQYIPERRCWVGEISADCYEDVLTVIGSFVAESLHPSCISKDEILAHIDRCADFSEVSG